MSVHSSQQSRLTDGHGSLSSILFQSQGNFRYATGSDLGASGDPNGSRAGASSQMGPPRPNQFIWGTNVDVDVCKRKFIEFLKDPRFSFDQADIDEAKFDWDQTNRPNSLYLIKLAEINQVPEENYLTINAAHLKEFDEHLYDQMIKFPMEVLQIFEQGADQLYAQLYPEDTNLNIYVRPFNTEKTTSIRGLNPLDVGRIVTINGMVTRVSVFIPEMYEGFFRCIICNFTRTVPVEAGRLEEPTVCNNCQGKFCYDLIHNRSKFVDKQLVKLQESPDDMPAGQIPSTIAIVAASDLVDQVSPGDRVSVTGIYMAHPLRVLSRQRKVRYWYRTTLNVLHYRKVKAGTLHDDSLLLRLSADRIDHLKALSKQENIYDLLSNSTCPSIYGHLDVKKGILLQLLGGTHKEPPGNSSDPKLRHFRSEINVLLCGDPGTSKSQMLQHVYKLVPRGQYTSGKGSSAVGLTAYVTRDLDTKQLILQIGALVMCDGGICCIDEFDKMSDSTRSVLHEVMEQQTLSIAKAGIVCQLNARTSVLAAANPVESEWNRDKTVIENIKLPDTLLSRFDLVFLILDPNTDEYDEKLARHLIRGYFEQQDDGSAQVIPLDVLKDYIAYAKAYIKPKLSEEAAQYLADEYIELRQTTKTTGLIKIYPRNFESLIRLSEAHAKMRLSHSVELEDVFEAVRLTKEAFMTASTDMKGGKIIA